MNEIAENLGLLVFLAPVIILIYLGWWLLFVKAGEKGWKGIIPIYNQLVMLRLIGKPWWWIFYIMIPVIGTVVSIIVLLDFLKTFNRRSITDIFLVIVIPFIYLPYLGFSKEVKYYGTDALEKGQTKTTEWIEAIGFAVIAATLIRWLIMEAYTIPTPSMENSLLVGDFLFVSKFHYGTRTTSTPLQVPLTHQKIWFTEIPSYVDWVRLPQYRLPGFTSVKNDDVVVFNIPPTGLNEGVEYPPDLKTNYIKRCVAIAGDTLVIKDGEVIINGKTSERPALMQKSYYVASKSVINERNLEKLGLGPEDYNRMMSNQSGEPVYQMYLTDERLDEVKKLNYITSVTEDHMATTEGIFPYSSQYYGFTKYVPDSLREVHWSGDNFGPLWIPKEGATIGINPMNLALYGFTIVNYDHNADARMEDGKLIIDGKEVSTYTFKQNYYFMMGDNRHNSLDSRYWGFVPEDHIVGKAFFIWLSIDRNASFFSKIRWSRFFKMIN